MNLSASIMLVDETVRPLRVEYDPDNTQKNYNPWKSFKTIDPELKVGDFVVIQTNTRHGFTIAKVTEIDFAVDFEDPQPWGWAKKFDKDEFNKILEIDKGVQQKVAKAQENKHRAELKAAMGLEATSFESLRAALGGPTPPPAPSADPGDPLA